MARTGRPVEHEEKRDAFTMRIGRPLHLRLKIYAGKNGKTMSALVDEILSDWWEARPDKATYDAFIEGEKTPETKKEAKTKK
jgi:hypothetical protein